MQRILHIFNIDVECTQQYFYVTYNNNVVRIKIQ